MIEQSQLNVKLVQKWHKIISSKKKNVQHIELSLLERYVRKYGYFL